MSFGTAGTLESDDGENMETCTRTNRGVQTRKGTMNASMGLGVEGRHPELPGVVGSNFIGETSYRGFYRMWDEMMRASDWGEVINNDDSWVERWLGEGAVSKLPSLKAAFPPIKAA